ncbi:MAG: hypothetical protein M0R51_14695 [Clostridia bacterium]|jgi:hypothetical protein|nr:hypothetical protein [Clostridia bacterium]
MGVLTPTSSTAKVSKNEKHAISQCLKAIMQHEMYDIEEDGETGRPIKVKKTYAQKFAEHCMENALSPDPKISAPFSRLVIEYVDGKAAVMQDVEKDDTPGVKFVLAPAVSKQVKENSLKELPEDTENAGIKIDIDDTDEEDMTKEEDGDNADL